MLTRLNENNGTYKVEVFENDGQPIVNISFNDELKAMKYILTVSTGTRYAKVEALAEAFNELWTSRKFVSHHANLDNGNEINLAGNVEHAEIEIRLNNGQYSIYSIDNNLALVTRLCAVASSKELGYDSNYFIDVLDEKAELIEEN